MGKLRSSEEPAVRNVKLMSKLYYHMSAAIIEKLGREAGTALIREGLKNFANDRVASMLEECRERGITIEEFSDYYKVRDMPMDGWVAQLDPPGCSYCPMADIWSEYGELGSYVGSLYCDIDYILFGGIGFDLEREEALTTGHSKCDMKVTKKKS